MLIIQIPSYFSYPLRDYMRTCSHNTALWALPVAHGVSESAVISRLYGRTSGLKMIYSWFSVCLNFIGEVLF